jgi:phosphocarrier protein
MIERTARIVNSQGLHARPAALIVKLAGTFGSDITVCRQGDDNGAVNAKSIMGVMMLAAECGSSIVFRAEGADAERAADALMALVADGFGEQ